MPTDRFARLPAEKKEIIRMAAISEFTRVPFEKVSINKIIQNADISRGSFYTYFEDKRDLLQYVFSDILMEAYEFFQKRLIHNQGNYWKTLDEMFLDWFQFEWSSNLTEIARIAILQTEGGRFYSCKGLKPMDEAVDIEKWIYDNGDWSDLRSQEKEFIRMTADLGMQTLVTSLGQRLDFPEKTEEIYRMFTQKLDIIQKGACAPGSDEISEKVRRNP